MGIRDLTFIMGTLLLFVPGLFVITVMPGDPSLAGGLTTRSRLGMVSIHLFAFWITGLALAHMYTIVRAFFRFNTRGEF